MSRGSNRDRMRRLVSLLPGIHLRELQRLLGISFTSTRYNVGKLSRSGAIVCQKDRRYLRLYPPMTGESERRLVYPLLRSQAPRGIMVALLRTPEGLTNKQLSEQTMLAKSTVSENLQRLVEAGLVALDISSHFKTVYVLANNARIIELLLSENEPAPSSAAERFIDIWDF